VTYRLVDTLPAEVLKRLRHERDAGLRQPVAEGMSIGKHRALRHKRFFAAYDRFLDRCSSIRWLEKPEVAEIIVENLYHHHGSKYQLFEYTVMPNHVHVLLLPLERQIADAGSIGHVADAAGLGDDFFSDEIADA